MVAKDIGQDFALDALTHEWDNISVKYLSFGGYIPFFVTEKSRSETALFNVIQ